ncbi:MAG: enoyl-CoA hydratase/isomerase family protein [Chloroflexota bacterium]|nr:enoyl-CoA hydratase/isomerase family protein [Dehalococcoidia bacterium]MDW8255221.1 enoyl-CoA hydratase/isomerase family protein [Chloroflexota bacterium]
MGFDAVIYEKHDGVAVVTLNRPAVLNAINVQIRDDLVQILPAIALDDEVRVAIVRGAGRAFSAGADVSEFGTAPSPIEAKRIRHLRPVWQLLAACPKPLIAAIHGYAIGAGVELAALCDLRLAAEGTVFAVPEVTLGLIPGAGGSQTLPRVVRPGWAREAILTGERFDATKALAIGLVNRVVPPARLEEEAETLARRIAANPPAAVQAAKRALHAARDLPLPQGLLIERRLARRLGITRQ